MKLIFATATALALSAGLAACGKPASKQAAAPTSPEATSAAASTTPDPAAPADDMDKMAMSADAKMAKGQGTVTAVDTTANTITLDHGPIAEAGWPAMTMGFKASPALVAQVKAGDKVAFDLKLQGGAGEITAIQKQ